MEKYKLILLLLVAVCWSCQKNDDEQANMGEPTSLKGTGWKLISFVDTEAGVSKEAKPADDRYYILRFNDDNTLGGFSSTNELQGSYDADYSCNNVIITIGQKTFINEILDGPEYLDILNKIQSFSIKKSELRLYDTDKKNYLLFKPQQ